MGVFSLQVNDFHMLTTIVGESSILDVCRDPEPTSAMILPNKWFFIRLKQLRKVFKKLYFARRRSSSFTNSKNEATCDNSLQLKAVNVIIVISSSISDSRRGLVPASFWFSGKFLGSIRLYRSSLQRCFEDIICYSVC